MKVKVSEILIPADVRIERYEMGRVGKGISKIMSCRLKRFFFEGGGGSTRGIMK